MSSIAYPAVYRGKSEAFGSADEHHDELRSHRGAIQKVEAAAWRAHVEAFTLMKLIGDPAGKVVIDIACGEGFYTRMIRQRGAGKVTGVRFVRGNDQISSGPAKPNDGSGSTMSSGTGEISGSLRTTTSRSRLTF